MSRKKGWLIGVMALGIIALFSWLMLRPLPFFTVTKNFERPIDSSKIPFPLSTLRAEECAACHQEFYDEWSTTIHSQAWTDPYFQTDWAYEDKPQICRNCHSALDRQQPNRVLGFRNNDKWDPILESNPDFDAVLQHQGVTCAVCHVRDGKILGPFGDTDAPHPVQKLGNSNEVCVRCHVVDGERWDTFMRIPPCGTVTEIVASREGNVQSRSGETVVPEIASLGCVDCHMPLVQRPLVPGGKVRQARRHLWRGGHDPEMVKRGLDINLAETTSDKPGTRAFALTLTNVGAAHYLPTGTPDRHLTVNLQLLDAQGNILKEQNEKLMRTILWRPFIIDLWDTRLLPNEPRSYRIEFPADSPATRIEATVRYHLLEESRRKRIGYENKDPISYPVFQQTLPIAINSTTMD